MAVSAGLPQRTAATPFPPIPLRRRLYGFGSIYGKTIRDSRLAFIIAAGLFGVLTLYLGVAIPTVFPTPVSRLEVDKLIGSMPAFDGQPLRQRHAHGAEARHLRRLPHV